MLDFTSVRQLFGTHLTTTPETRAKLIEGMKAMKAAVDAGKGPSPEFTLDEADSVQIPRNINRQRGSWFQVAKNYDDNPRDGAGENLPAAGEPPK